MDNEAYIARHPHGPKPLVSGLAEFVETVARLRRIELQIERCCLNGLLLIAGQAGEGVGEGLGDQKLDRLYDTKYFHDFIAEVVDHFNRDTARRWFVERSGDVAVERRPRLFVDFSPEGSFEALVRIVCAEEVGVADEKAFLVVICVDEPAGDTFGVVAANFASVGVEDINAVDLHLHLAVLGRKDVDVGFAENNKWFVRKIYG